MAFSIGRCKWSDLPLLEEAFPSGSNRLHAGRFAEQQRGECLYLVASSGSAVLGHAKVLWGGSVHASVRGVLGNVPELRRLFVSEEARGQGVGSELMNAAEQAIVARGLSSIGLGVAVTNVDAQRLYRRLGYEDWGRGTLESRWTLLDDQGQPVEHSHRITYMCKDLRQDARVLTVA